MSDSSTKPFDSTNFLPPFVGDVVTLNSGGAKMTVSDVDEHGNVTCFWFQNQVSPFGFGGAGQTLESRRFPMSMLTNTSRIK
jgi:uncharacterized protein YodC (DUF2158 family)